MSDTRSRKRAILGCLLVTGLAAGPAAVAQDGADGPAAERLAAEDTAPRRPPWTKRVANGFRNVEEDGIYLVTFPARPTRKGVIRAAAVGGGLVVLFLLDDEIRDWAQDRRTDGIDDWESRIEPLGEARTAAAGALLVYSAGSLAGSDRVTETGRAMVEALFFADLFQLGGKALFGRAAPGDAPGAGDWFEEYPDGIFPSGHAARAFALATVVAERHGKTAAWIAYPLATLVGLSRIESDAHWASDVLAGATLGWGVGKAVVRLRGNRHEARFAFQPLLDPRGRGAGVMLTVRF
jgi:membrane-associated phospholipid phosphatase